MRHAYVITAFSAVAMAAPAAAQFSSDFPGVPRASISISGGTQARTAWALSGYRIPGSGAGTGVKDTIAAGLRLGFGRSYRIQSQFEIGWDFTLIDGLFTQVPTTATTTTGTSKTPGGTDNLYMRGLTTYGIRIGGKYRPIVSLDPNGYGYEFAVGGGFQPQLKPFFGIEKLGDSTRSGGQFNGDPVLASKTFGRSPFGSLTATTILAGMGSYRSKRLLGDVALVVEKGPDRAATDPSPIADHDGVSLHAGGSFRLSPGLAAGATYWGSGSPPWWDEVRGAPGTVSNQQFGFLLQFGSNPESGIDLMYTAPNGKYAESGRLYIRARSTR